VATLAESTKRLPAVVALGNATLTELEAAFWTSFGVDVVAAVIVTLTLVLWVAEPSVPVTVTV